MKRGLLVIFLVIIAGILGYVFTYFLFYAGSGQKDLALFEEEASLSPAQPVQKLFAVVVENLPDARPQSGLGKADFVIETLTESGITRMLAFFSEQDAEMIGPVRSARPYFVDLALGFGAALAHSGGSKEALQKIEELGENFKDINEFFNEFTFWRDKERKTPHNLFTSTQLLQKLWEEKGWEGIVNQKGWETSSDEQLPAEAVVQEIIVDFSDKDYEVTYKFDQTTKTYLREMKGQPQIDKLTNERLQPVNLVILHAKSQVIDEKLLTIDLDITGTGRATIFRDGHVIHARWQKLTPQAPLRVLDADDSLVKLAPGQVWFSVVDQYGEVKWQ